VNKSGSFLAHFRTYYLFSYLTRNSKGIGPKILVKQQIDDNVNAMVRVEKGGRDGLDGHVQTRTIIDEAQTTRPVIGEQ
jgi:hypothetical protein